MSHLSTPIHPIQIPAAFSRRELRSALPSTDLDIPVGNRAADAVGVAIGVAIAVLPMAANVAIIATAFGWKLL